MINPINNNGILDYNNIKGKVDEAKQGAFEAELQKAIEEKDEKKLRQACSDLEAIFVSMVFKQMRNTIQKSELTGSSFAEDMYQDMLYEKYAEEISKGKGLGLGEMLYKQLSKSMGKEKIENNAE